MNQEPIDWEANSREFAERVGWRYNATTYEWSPPGSNFFSHRNVPPDYHEDLNAILADKPKTLLLTLEENMDGNKWACAPFDTITARWFPEIECDTAAHAALLACIAVPVDAK